MNNKEFIMLRSLNKEDYEEGENPLWKVRKNKWEHNSEKMLEAIDICGELYKKGLAERKSVICGLCGEAHFDKYRYKITNKGIELLSIPRKEVKPEIKTEKISILSGLLNRILKNKANTKNNHN